MKLKTRKYSIKDKSIAVYHKPRNNWNLTPTAGLYSKNSQEFSKHFSQTEMLINFKSKQELLYNLKNFQTQYNFNLFPLIHISSQYSYKNYDIYYSPKGNHWKINSSILDYIKNYNVLEKKFKTRKEAAMVIDSLS